MQSMRLASLPVPVYFASQLAFSCEGGQGAIWYSIQHWVSFRVLQNQERYRAARTSVKEAEDSGE